MFHCLCSCCQGSVLCGWLLIKTLYFWLPCRTLEAAQCSQFTDAGFQALCRVSTLLLKACLQLNMALCVPLFQFIRSISWTHEKNNKSFHIMLQKEL